jgi:hypothetical protein
MRLATLSFFYELVSPFFPIIAVILFQFFYSKVCVDKCATVSALLVPAFLRLETNFALIFVCLDSVFVTSGGLLPNILIFSMACHNLLRKNLL